MLIITSNVTVMMPLHFHYLRYQQDSITFRPR